MNKKKFLAIIASVNLLISFIFFLFGKINYITFFIVAAATAIIAYKILPKMK